ncbi:sec-independent translocation protein mttA/Hcf106 [Kribbella flavida DSM 17836]|uniref:Sec-independent translocation protein mttA/Hcf106 n=1 Tax=Kribbella flavida (strain DSM 17836 / JCM 10339 / NBRC 14399) TaxID=479435 RepID=D2PSG8_KRIFD|nr:twin-arginine translocase TatA/TatE family subunit [Kribbella flavida]ADB33106.1 sec-independent translocation protein mttA/Hcf106 [Kribbella flavida DSM 17836]
MQTLLGMPQGAEWLIILGIVVLLFGSAKLPTLVKQLGRSKKIWAEEVGPGANKPAGELGEHLVHGDDDKSAVAGPSTPRSTGPAPYDART